MKRQYTNNISRGVQLLEGFKDYNIYLFIVFIKFIHIMVYIEQ